MAQAKAKRTKQKANEVKLSQDDRRRLDAVEADAITAMRLVGVSSLLPPGNKPRSFIGGRDVAALAYWADVSTTTVYRYFYWRGSLQTDTKERIERACRKMRIKFVPVRSEKEINKILEWNAKQAKRYADSLPWTWMQ